MKAENEELKALIERYIRDIGNVTVEDIMARAGSTFPRVEIEAECDRQAKLIMGEVQEIKMRQVELDVRRSNLMKLTDKISAMKR